MTNTPLKPGIYRHFKGNRYEVIDLVKHSETEETLVLYRALYGERGLWVRPLSMFVGNKQLDDKMVPRFSYEGPA
ncbi:MAG: DUF1653 domain-containing protein [Pseudomonadales bacterium]|jgi:hypothetical protein